MHALKGKWRHYSTAPEICTSSHHKYRNMASKF